MRLTVTMIGLGAAALLAACGGTDAPPLASSTSTSTADPTSSTSTSTAASMSSTTSTSAARPLPSTPAATARSVSSASTSTARSTSSTRQSVSGNTPCAPSGTALKVSAQNVMFNVSCLAAPAAKAFTIDFNNQDTVSHNVSIYTADPMADKNAKSLFQGQLIDGGKTIVYSVPALSAGTYYFNCIVHPAQMYGTFVVK